MRFFKPFYIGLTLTTIFAFSIISICLIQPLKSNIKTSNKNDYKNLFTNNEINENFIKYHLNNIKKIDVIKFFCQNKSDALTFNEKQINENLIFYFQKKINEIFKLSENLYVNLKYWLNSENELHIDVRWANKKDILNTRKTNIYCDNILFKLH